MSTLVARIVPYTEKQKGPFNKGETEIFLPQVSEVSLREIKSGRLGKIVGRLIEMLSGGKKRTSIGISKTTLGGRKPIVEHWKETNPFNPSGPTTYEAASQLIIQFAAQTGADTYEILQMEGVDHNVDVVLELGILEKEIIENQQPNDSEYV